MVLLLGAAALIPITLSLVAAGVDLVRREVPVSPWWAAALLPWLALLVLLVLPAWQWGAHAHHAHATVGAIVLTAGSAFLLTGSVGLTFARGIAPGGPVIRRVGGYLGGIALFTVPIITWPAWVRPGDSVEWSVWPILACWAALFQVLLLDGVGSARLEVGRRTAATWLAASGMLFLGASGCVAMAAWIGRDPSMWRDAGLAAASTITLLAVIRGFAGPLDRRVTSIAAMSWVSPAISLAAWLTWQPVPPGISLARLIDLRGEPVTPTTRPHALWVHRCARVVETGALWGSCPPGEPLRAIPSATTPITALDPRVEPVVGDEGLDVVTLTETTPGPPNVWSEGDTLVVAGVPMADDSAAHAAVRVLERLDIAWDERLTLQRYLQICGSWNPDLNLCNLVTPEEPDPAGPG